MYFITCFQKISTNKLDWLDVGSTRTFGFEEEYSIAVDKLHENICDMHECLYMYAVIEKIEPGIHPDVESRQFFKYDAERDGFFEIDEPKEFKCYCNIALG